MTMMTTTTMAARWVLCLGVCFGILGEVGRVQGAEPRPGGFSPALVTEPEVVEAAKKAVEAQEKVLKKEAAGSRLVLVEILKAEKQVVAGMNFRLTLKVKVDDEEKEAEATVWWQAWRKEEPYMLTAWGWK